MFKLLNFGYLSNLKIYPGNIQAKIIVYKCKMIHYFIVFHYSFWIMQDENLWGIQNLQNYKYINAEILQIFFKYSILQTF